jgi:acetoin utilization protein AcuB
MQVKQQMARKLITISPDTSILKAIQIMRRHSIRHLPVVEGKVFVGLVTEGDLRQASLLSIVDRVTIEDVMIKRPITIHPDAPIEDAAKLVFRHKIGGLPVVRERKLVGILTVVDLLTYFIRLHGILKKSSQIDLILGDKPDAFEGVYGIFRRHGAEVISVGTSNHKDRRKRVYRFRLRKISMAPIAASLKKKGYKVLSPET